MSGSGTIHPCVFSLFNAICAARNCAGDVLEIGAVASDDTLLCLPSLATANSRVGVNLAPPQCFHGFKILQADANCLSSLPEFEDESFDTVLCNSVLEHDRFFWRTVAEMRRLTRPGGVIGIGVPGYTKLPLERLASRLSSVLSRIGIPASILDPMRASTLTLQVHHYPVDYYRFSSQALTDVLLEGLEEIEVHHIMCPPRLIGFGVKPAR